MFRSVGDKLVEDHSEWRSDCWLQRRLWAGNHNAVACVSEGGKCVGYDFLDGDSRPFEASQQVVTACHGLQSREERRVERLRRWTVAQCQGRDGLRRCERVLDAMI